jgi:pyridoxine/pyridoxamine 5'-phosphate oxidase
VISKDEIYAFMQQRPLAVVSSVTPDGRPEAALVNIAVTKDLEAIFDSTDAARKCTNLRRDPHIALVIGWDDARTLQIEGIADEPKGSELEALKEVYFAAHPSGRNRAGWPGLTYFRVRPRWARFSNYFRPRQIDEITFP